MAATPKPLRKEIKKRVKSTGKLYKTPDAKAGFNKQQIRAMKKSDRPAIKKVVKKFGK
jgi:hypothetical protein